MFVHTLAGSPLRMNLSQRYIDNPLVYGSTTARQFGANADGQDYQEARGWAFSRAQAQNRAYVSAGDLLTLPHYSVQHIERGPSGSNFLVDDTQMNQSQQGVNKQGIAVAARQNLQVQEAILGQQFINDIRAVTSMEVNDSLALSVAQAAFTNLTPRTSPTNWQSDASAGAFLPADWQPVYLKKVDPSDSTTDPYHYLFQFDYRDATTPPNVTTPELLARWPLAQRAVMYTTGNNRVTGSPVNGFDPAAVRGRVPDRATAEGRLNTAGAGTPCRRSVLSPGTPTAAWRTATTTCTSRRWTTSACSASPMSRSAPTVAAATTSPISGATTWLWRIPSPPRTPRSTWSS